jgi:intracellular sulfur oxidation DsrE/DsrF family protein
VTKTGNLEIWKSGNREIRKMRVRIMLAAFLFLTATSAMAQTAALPVPAAPVARDVPGAKELPDKALTYKILFDAEKGADKPGDINPTLLTAGRFVNTLSTFGVPPDHQKIVVVFHGDATDIILTDDAYKARNNGQGNPNIAIIQSLKKAGVDFRVCGQAVMARKIDPKTIQPEIELDLWALTTITSLEMRGWVRIGS